MPSYLQMVSGLSATKSGLLLVPLTVGILIASVGSGAWVSRTGRYRWMPAAGAFFTAVSLSLLSTLTIDTELWTISLYLFVCGVGTGIGFQIPDRYCPELLPYLHGRYRYRRPQLLPADRSHARLGCRRHPVRQPASGPPGRKAGPHRSGLRWSRRPELPHPIERRPDVGASEDRDDFSSYNDALAPVYPDLAPIMAVAFVLLLFVREKPLAVTNEEGPQGEAVAST